MTFKQWYTLQQKRLEDNEHRYYRCPRCSQILRIQKGTQNVSITCPRCGLTFQQKSYPSVKWLLRLGVIVLTICCGIVGGVIANKIMIPSIHVATTQEAYTQREGATAVAKKMNASVVAITTEAVKTNSFWYGSQVVSGAGSGVIYSSNGYIVTCAHVIKNASKIQVTTSDQKKYEARLVKSFNNQDIAIIKINASGLKPAIFANSDKIKQAESIYAVGNPEGKFSNSISSGIISATSRTITVSMSDDESTSRFRANEDNVTLNVIQMDAAVSPGNSGGGLFDANGNLIGIVNAKSAGTGSEGLGFAIPSNKVKQLISTIQ